MQAGRFLGTALAMGLAFTSASARGALVNFDYTQNDATTGAGTIAPFAVDDGGGPINFTATPMPLATVVNPNPGLTPVGYVGAFDTQAGNSNEANEAVGLVFAGTITATGTRGAEIYTIQIPLKFVAKQTQSPDVSDYTWSINFGDTALQDATSTSIRTAMWFSRDDVIDAAETANTFQRYTLNNFTFVNDTVDAFTSTTTSSTAIKDASDAGNPAGTDAEGRDLAFYFGWRDQGALSEGAGLVDTFTVGGFLNADEATLQLVPEPATAGLLGIAAAGLLLRRRRAA